MANFLYYGNGECYLNETGTSIRGAEIHYRGSAKVAKTTSDNYVLFHKNNTIIIFPKIPSGTLTSLFKYTGTLIISRAIICDENARRVHFTIKKIMDYAELLSQNAEDMDRNVEDMDIGFLTNNTSLRGYKNIIENLHTSEHNVVLLDKNNEVYAGDFHIHPHSRQAMTGAKHSSDSEHLTCYVNESILEGRATRKTRRKKNRRPPVTRGVDKKNITQSKESSGGY